MKALDYLQQALLVLGSTVFTLTLSRFFLSTVKRKILSKKLKSPLEGKTSFELEQILKQVTTHDLINNPIIDKEVELALIKYKRDTFNNENVKEPKKA